MKKRKIPLRTCVVTGEKLDKRDLLRIVKDKEGKIRHQSTCYRLFIIFIRTCFTHSFSLLRL